MPSLASVNILFKTDLTSLSKGLADAGKRLDASGKKFQEIGGQLTLGLTLPLAGFGAAAINAAKQVNSNLNTSLERLKSKGQDAAISLGNTLAPAVIKVADTISGLLTRYERLDSGTKRIITGVGLLAAGVGPLLVAFGAFQRSIAAAIPLVKTFSAVILANPLGVLAATLGLVAGGFLLANSRLTGLTNANREFSESLTVSTSELVAEKVELDNLVKIAKDDRLGRLDRLDAIDKINKISPEYLDNLTLENIATEEGTAILKNYNEALLTRARVLAAQEKLVDVQKRLLDLQLGQNDAIKPSLWQNLKAGILSAGNATSFFSAQTQFTVKNLLQETSELESLQEKLTDYINTNKDVADSLKPVVNLTGKLNDNLRSAATAISGVAPVGATPVETEGGVSIPDGLPELTETLTPFEERLFEFRETTRGILEGAAADFVSGFAEIGAAVLSGNISLGSVLGSLVGLLGDVAIQIGKAAIKIGITMKAVKLSFSNPLAAIAAGGALVLVGTLLKGLSQNFGGGSSNVPALASGGLATGPTLAVVGDNIGARSGNPEVIAPLDKLKDYIKPAAATNLELTGEIELVAKGDSLVGVINSYNVRNRALGGEFGLKS